MVKKTQKINKSEDIGEILADRLLSVCKKLGAQCWVQVEPYIKVCACNIVKYIERVSMRFVAGLVIFTYVVGALGIGETIAYYGDKESSSGNVFMAQSLDFSLASDAFEGVQNFGATTTASTEMVNEGTLNFQYTTQTDNISCDSDFLGDLTLVAKRGGSTVYEGALSGFVATTTDMETDWDFLFFLDPFSTVAQGAMCDLNIVFNGWQEGFPSPAEGGYSDEEVFPISLMANAVVLNEVLPNPEGLDTQAGLQGEWVELYNNSIFPLDLTGWYVKDATDHTVTLTASTTFNGRVLIGSRSSYLEWIVLYMNGQILNNDGDTVSLYTQSGILVDTYSYGNKATDDDSDSNHTAGGDNQNPAGNETSGQEGKSDARKPDGYGAWVDPVPTPGLTNALTDEQAEYIYQLMLEQFVLLESQKASSVEEEPVVEENSATTTDAVVFEDVVVEEDTNATSTDEVATTTETSLVDAETSTTTDETSSVLTGETDLVETGGTEESSAQTDEDPTVPQEQDQTLTERKEDTATDETDDTLLDISSVDTELYREEDYINEIVVTGDDEGISGTPEDVTEEVPKDEEVVEESAVETPAEEETVTELAVEPEPTPEPEQEPITEQEPTPEPE